MSKKSIALLILAAVLLIIPVGALAQTYSFRLPQELVDVYWNGDGTLSIDYLFVFANDPQADPIDYVDVGLPNENYDVSSISAEVEGQIVTDIQPSPYVKPGVAIGLGSFAIQPGDLGRLHVHIGNVPAVYHPDSADPGYASAVFSPTWFGDKFVSGTVEMVVTYHLPPGVQPDEPRWHSSPAGFPSQPVTGFDSQDRITYSWQNPQASPSRQYQFGASFPTSYVPQSAIVRTNPLEFVATLVSGLLTLAFPLLCLGFIGLIIYLGIAGERKRKLQYLPPKISIEGHGIKRGLTAVEVAILIEQPVDKILTMILFSAIKRNAARVVAREPLRLEVLQPIPEDLRSYEKDFLQAFQLQEGPKRQKALQDAVIDLVKSVSSSMKGFSRRETIAYYRETIQRAWAQVEAAGTPEVKSQKFDEVMDWTMLDRDFSGRTREVFRTGPVFIPTWWGRYDPGYGRGGVAPASGPSSGAPSTSGPSLPHLPGSDFAASVVGGMQSFSANVVGNLTDFTSRITQQTNPPPKTTSTSRSSSGGGSCACACACACAGCACACAGGGR